MSESPPLPDTFAPIQDDEDELALARNRFTSAQDGLEETKNMRAVLAVSSLPPEVLSLVFEFLAICETPEQFCLKDIIHNWLPATQVCRQWRYITLNSPRFWSSIYFTAPLRWAELQLERSQSAPLSFRSPFDFLPQSDAVFSLMFDNATRLKEISIRGCTIKMLEQILLHSPLPSLETLSLSIPFGTYFTERYQITSDSFPRLRHLNLNGCVFRLGPPLLNLHSLSIVDMHEYSSTPLTVAELCTALGQMSNLTSLELHHALALPHEPTLDLSADLVPLPSLTYLSLKTHEARTLEILKYLQVPNITSIHVECDQHDSPDIIGPIASYAFAMLPQHPMWRCLAQVSLRTYASASKDSSVEVAIWDRSGDEVQPAVEDDPVREPLFRLKLCGMGDLETELSVCKHLPEADMSILDFFAEIPESRRNLTDHTLTFFREMKDIQYLRVCCSDVLRLVLADGPKGPQRRQAPEPYSLPSLRQVIVKQSDLYSRATDVKVSSGLQRLLADRRKWGTEVLEFEPDHIV